MSASCCIGTSGFSYDHWVGAYYPPELHQRDRLAFYSRDFSTVEINATFYRLQSAAAFRHWQEATPTGFRFTIKGSRHVTHVKRLRDSRAAIQRFFTPSKKLGKKLAVTLWQTPPNLARDPSLLDDFLSVLIEEAPRGVRQVFEFRGENWLTAETYTVLDSHGCGVVIADSNRFPSAGDTVCGGFVYLRFHGRTANGYNYRVSDLKVWAEKIKRWMVEGRDVFAYFNNDAGAYAIRNAKTLKAMVES
ncbi:MAG: DUF72 domain-containing protein [Actinomycetota bacterium]